MILMIRVVVAVCRSDIIDDFKNVISSCSAFILHLSLFVARAAQCCKESDATTRALVCECVTQSNR